jgi:uncharacterized repeat protein (TIGR02543 family)
MKARLALVDANAPTLNGVALSDGPYHRGNTVTVSLSFSEIVVPKPSSGFSLDTSWGLLGYVSSSSGGNVLTFSGTINASKANGTRLTINGFSGLTLIKDLAGNEVASGNLQFPSFNVAISESVDYTISYGLAGGVLPQGEDPNPTTYNYDSDVISLTNPVRQGYTFDGWSGTGINGLTNAVVIARHSHGERVYFAHWTQLPKPPYPPYLENADSDIVANYDEWAERYGYDPNGEHEAAFLLDVAPWATPIDLRIVGIEMAEGGARVRVTATAGGEAVDLSQINGVISVSAGDDLGALAPKAASGITYSEGEATIFVPASAGRFVKAVIGLAPPAEEE